MAHDAIIQIRNGFFPTYLGQSIYSPDGALSVRAPYYPLLVQFIDIITIRSLNPLTIQHATILFTAIFSVFSAYYLIKNLAPTLTWAATFLALIYVTSPGVMSLIYLMDMYLSFLTTPFVFLIVYSLARINRKNDTKAFILLSVGISFVWMAHPPIALWTTFIAIIFIILNIFNSKLIIKNYTVLIILLIGLNLWQFFSIFTLGHEPNTTSWGLNPHLAQLVISELSKGIPDVFLPLSVGKKELHFLQLGYALWAVIILSVLTAVKSITNIRLIWFFLGLISIIILLLFPFNRIGFFLWEIMPPFVHELTRIWPNQRFYLIIAALATITGALSLQKINEENLIKFKKFIPLLLIFLTVWNINELRFFVNNGNKIKSANESIANPSDSWSKSDRIDFFGWALDNKYLQNRENGGQPVSFDTQIYDTELNKNADYDNLQIVMNRCFNNPISIDKENISLKPTEPKIIEKLSLHSSNYYMICADIEYGGGNIYFQLLDSDAREAAALLINSNAEQVNNKKKIAIPFYFSNSTENESKEFILRMYSHQKPNINIEKLGIIKYDPKNLPIRIESYTPYRSSVNLKSDNSEFMEVMKVYLPGYIAKVNGQVVSIIRSKSNTILIPLNNTGKTIVELSYTGTSEMKIAFIISLTLWILVITYLFIQLIPGFKHLLKKEKTV